MVNGSCLQVLQAPAVDDLIREVYVAHARLISVKYLIYYSNIIIAACVTIIFVFISSLYFLLSIQKLNFLLVWYYFASTSPPQNWALVFHQPKLHCRFFGGCSKNCT